MIRQSNAPSNCAACGGELEAGYIPDAGEQVRPPLIWATVWVRGVLRRRKGVIAALSGGGIDTTGETPLALDAYRCVECGRVEFYATREAARGTTNIG
ncbi:MAG: hypothetical protein R3B07_31865 [Polyangiaceae bacterium]